MIIDSGYISYITWLNIWTEIISIESNSQAQLSKLAVNYI